MMDETITPQSELLQSRLRDHKAETARSRTQSPPSAAENHLQSGRDDDIFLEEDPSNRIAPRNLHLRNSPAAPSAWRYERDSSRSRPSNTSGPSTNTTPRAMGAREMEDYIDKLNKQNFNLKMEVFHRREKAEQLEKKLADYAQLEQDLTGALDANEELVTALEARDRAIDEAVVIISDLEQKNRDLELQIANAQLVASTREPATASDPTLSLSPGHKSQNPSRKAKERKALPKSVSPDILARMIELSKPFDETPGRVPSFLQSKAPTTAALRSMYVEGDQFVRPLPSHATLLADSNTEQKDDYLSGLRSPRLSELSESDLKSLYNHQAQTTTPENVDTSSCPPEDITQQTNARVSKWVAERAVSPVDPHAKSQGPDAVDFQPLDRVVKSRPDISRVDQGLRPRGRQPQKQRAERNGNTPPMSLNSVFGQNTFPPTPDTMLTRASNPSTTSSAPDKPPTSAEAQRDPLFSQLNQTNSALSQEPIKYTAPTSLLPNEFDAYGSPPQERKPRPVEPAREYNDDAMYRSYSSDGSFTQNNYQRYLHRNQNSLTGTTIIDADSMRGASTTRTSPSPPRQPFDIGQRFRDEAYPTLPYRAFASAPRNRYTQADSMGQQTPTNPSFSHVDHSRQESSTSNITTPTQPQPLPVSLASILPLSPEKKPLAHPAAATTSPIAVRTTKGLAARTATIRDRFLRRKDNPTPTPAPASQIPMLQAEVPQRRRSGSITRRFRLRRSSTEQGPVPALPPSNVSRYPYSATETSTVNSTVNSSFVSSTDNNFSAHEQSNITLPSLPQRAKSERHRPLKSTADHSDRSGIPRSSFRVNEPATPESYGASGAVSNGNLSPGSSSYGPRQRRPSLTGRVSSDGRGFPATTTDIPPVPATPPEISRQDAESESAAIRQSKWHLGRRSRSNSRSRKEPTWPTLTAYDGTYAGRRM